MPPLYAVPACRDVLQLCAMPHELGEASLAHRAGPSSAAGDGGGKPPHSTWIETGDTLKEWLGIANYSRRARYIVPLNNPFCILRLDANAPHAT